MSVTYGFYDSLNGDRKYNAEQISSIFDGIVMDGVLQSVGGKLIVKSMNTPSLKVKILSGRAWFNHTWILNDTTLSLTVPTPEKLLNRYDAVVIEVNSSSDVRANSIKIISGTPSSSPAKPTMANSATLHQYPLAYIYVAADATAITQANITNCVGTSACPYVTAPLKSVSVDELYAQWEAQWNEWMTSTKTEFTGWEATQKKDFNTWYNNVKGTLSGDVATDLTNRVVAIENELDGLADALAKI